MYLTITLNCESSLQREGFKTISKEIHSYDEVESILNSIVKERDYWIDNMIGMLYVEKREFNKIPLDKLPKNKYRELESKDWWYIYMDLRGMIIFEVLDGSSGRTILDPFSSKEDDMNIGDIVFHYPSNRYYLVKLNPHKFGFNISTLLGSKELYEGPFDYEIPLYTLRKASEYEVQSLNLRNKFELLENNNSDDIIEKYPWL